MAVITRPAPGREATALLLLLAFLTVFPVNAQAQSGAEIYVPDVVCSPGEKAHVRAHLHRTGIMGKVRPFIPGEVLVFHTADGTLLASQLTDATGLARLSTVAGKPGLSTVEVSLSPNQRFRASPASGRIFVLSPDRPLFFITVAGALYKEVPSSGFFSKKADGMGAPLPGSIANTNKTEACATLIYLTGKPVNQIQKVRDWLLEHGFPDGPIVAVSYKYASGDHDSRLPEKHPLRRLHTNTGQRVFLVTADTKLADLAARSGTEVFLLESDKGKGDSIDPGEEEKGNSLHTVSGWKEIPIPCAEQK